MIKSGFFDGSELRRSLWMFRRELLWIGVFSFIANILMLTPTIYLLQIYDRVLTGRSELTLLVVTLFLITFFGFMTFAEWIRSRLLVQTGVRIDEELNSRVFNATFEAYLRQVRRNPVEAFSAMTTLRQFLTGQGILAIFDSPWTVIYIIVIFLLHPLLGLLSVLFACIQLGLTWMSHRATVEDIEHATRADADSAVFVQSKLRNIEPLHAMGMLGNMKRRWFEVHERSLDDSGVSLEKLNRQQSTIKFVRFTMQSLTLGAAALLVIDGRLTPGAMIASSVLMTRALQPLDLLVSSWKLFVQAKMAFSLLESVLDEFPERIAGKDHGDPAGNLTIQKLSATVPGRRTPILDDISADIPSGRVLVMIGPSGSGKSTLARCMVGVWPDVEGGVLIDGEPVESWDRRELGPHIGYLPQDIELFEGSIAENIARFGKVDPEKVVEAARRTGIHEMILRFPAGYDTEIGEAGSMLSAGQRQRLGLARAIYGNPAIIVLDEPNANLDDVGDHALLQAIEELKKQGKTVVVISHRPYIVKVADLLLI
ncbi:MAG: type I secretion system permease/ATPase, partial [Candidatus Omnitrophica bacterium]|nr:type I secretion system permease/ATPase [Candidatus Omnitrophota bacterium]